jgi:hypothetical protein
LILILEDVSFMNPVKFKRLKFSRRFLLCPIFAAEDAAASVSLFGASCRGFGLRRSERFGLELLVGGVCVVEGDE